MNHHSNNIEQSYMYTWNFKNLNATTRQQIALQGKKKKKRPNITWTHCVFRKWYKNASKYSEEEYNNNVSV
jgi:hypothetical protein